MTGQVIDRSTASILILIIPFALLVVFLYSAWPIILGIVAIALALRFWQQYQWKMMGDKINPAFNALLKENQGCLTAVDLSLRSEFPLGVAQRFLEQRANDYGAKRQQLGDRGTAYYFLTASALGAIFADSEPVADLEALSREAIAPTTSELTALIQAELAKRLDVHSGTLTKRKSDPSFGEWSRQKDPEGIAWQYAPKQKLFIPQPLNPLGDSVPTDP